MAKSYFSELLPELATRSARASISMLGFSNPALRKHLREVFSATYGEQGSFLGDPVFEATFGWETADKTMAELSGQLLTRRLVDAMDNPPGGWRSEYRFRKDIKPYRHQVEAWQLLAQKTPQSVVVTSGTGSGKTECFMVPILDSLVREQADQGGQLTGVRALFLYPLNALINSQRDRLLAWTDEFKEQIRFCLYNGLTPNEVPAHKHAETPNQVIDRKELRLSPPPILVTNATMLEFMLVRAQDAPILQKSQGTLRWIVLDEAHTYIGSQAAELALLLRRVMHGFGVSSDDVRFVATSATIGDPGGEAGQHLAEFLAGLAGVSRDRVHVVGGRRKVPELPQGNAAFADSPFDALMAIEPDSQSSAARFEALSANRVASRIRNAFAGDNAKKPAWQLRELVRHTYGGQSVDPKSISTLLRWLDLLTGTVRPTPDGPEPFLPLRSHLFHQTLSGLWACVDPGCRFKAGSALASPDWPFGQVFFDDRKHCGCGAPVFEIRSCNDCNTSFLYGRKISHGSQDFLQQARDTDPDEFSLDVEEAEDDSAAEEGGNNGQAIVESGALVTGGGLGSPTRIDKATFELHCDDVDRSCEIRVVETLPQDGGSILRCPACGGAHPGNDRMMFRRALLGGPFLLGQVIPTLLEFCPDGDDPLARPYRGRRMISFTDSRQGTARIAAKIQQDSERNRIRGLVYGRLVANGAVDESSPVVVDQIKQIKELKALPDLPPIRIAIADAEEKLSRLLAPPKLGFNDLAEWLATNEVDIKRWIFDYYHRLDPQMFPDPGGQVALAKMLLMREIARRPKRLNSLETLGLAAISYPKLEAIKALPATPLAKPLALDEWRDFLKVCLDFFVRENTFVDLPDMWKKWGGQRVARKWLLPPVTNDRQTASIRKWPQSRPAGQRQHRLVRLLSYSLGISLATPLGRDTVDGLLRDAWQALVDCQVLSQSMTGRFLSFDDIAIAPLRRSWLCPVTRRVLDTTFKGVTPYLPEEPTDATARCREIQVPVHPLVGKDFPSEGERLRALREWIGQSGEVNNLRDEGLWSDLSDRIVEGAAYFRAAEHSAQQSAARLNDYEEAFKAGRLNLLSCSTTMEMGVDIGGISVVAMNNVPPHPANYLQRAGRAGRRSETRSVALTLCKSNPHDQHVFLNTRWPFDTRLPMPAISLSSAVIVQRHVNSMLLSHFLREGLGAAQVNLNKLDCDWFFVSTDADSRAERFIHWCETFDEVRVASLANGLRQLIRNTCFDSVSTLGALTTNAADEMRRVLSTWMSEYRAVIAQISQIPGPNQEKEPAFRALSMQKRRLAGEYLLSELATEGFLPGYGFPTDIVSFDTLTVDELEAMKKQRAGDENRHREDNFLRRRDLPSRDIVTGLREYAPGADIVMDGLVYRSAGITLNWHAPADVQEISEIQSIRRAWRCSSCGATGTAPNHPGQLYCADCGAPIEAKNALTFLEPAGFAVDLFESPHNDISTQQFVQVETPWIQAEGDWVALPNTALGRFRSSPGGHVFFHSSGLHRAGYAICLECGRAEPMHPPQDDGDGNDGATPAVFSKPHRRLRGRQGAENSECSGSQNPWAVKPHMHLGHASRTDVLELHLKGNNGLYLNEPGLAYTLAVAIRDSIAELLGVEADELGCDAKQVRIDGGAYCYAILVFDRYASGYCTAIAPRITEVLRKAHEQLVCPKDCDSACQSCLLSYDNRYRFDELDRKKGLEFLTGDWLNALRLPEGYRYFGVDSFAEYQALPEAVLRELGRPDARGLRLFFSGDPAEWDIAVSPVRRLIYRWLAKEKPITIVLQKDALACLSEESRFSLAALASHDLVSVVEAEGLQLPGKFVVFGEIEFSEGFQYWASGNAASANFGPRWGNIDNDDVLVSGRARSRLLMHRGERELPLQVIRPAAMADPSNVELVLRHELDGRLQSFGGRFWNALGAAFPELAARLQNASDELVRIAYRDRYLNSPVSLALLIETVSRLKEHGKAAQHLARIQVDTVRIAPVERARPAFNVWSDWTDSHSRDEVLVKAFDWCGIDCVLTTDERSKTPHARILELDFASGVSFRIRLDQGFSYWQVTRESMKNGWRDNSRFDFSKGLDEQAERIAQLDVRLSGQGFPTYVWLSRIHSE